MQLMMAHVCSPQLAGLTLHPAISLTRSRLRCQPLCTNGQILACPLVWKRGLLNGRLLGFSLGVTPLKKTASGVRCSWSPIALVGSDQAKQGASVALKAATSVTIRAHQAFQADPLIPQVAYALVIIVFSVWVLGPILRTVRHRVFKRDDRRWKDSQTRYVLSSYLRPVFLWVGVILLCRAFDPLVLSTEASQAIKHRFLNFVRSLSTVVVFAYCTASLSRQLQKLTMEHQSLENSRNVGVQFIGNAVYSAVWVAAVCLFMELLGFSTQKWLTAGGLGTVLLTLAGREIFTNFLSGVMIHATRPFVENEWIQSKIEGYEVSGTVEQVGWWSPTIIRGDDREAVHIPNHKFTVSVVRNLTQKSHWRIKSHLCISHLDVNKIPNIVADMRKVLGKHPQVEQKRLHRRVFLENVNAENQALMILVSCFVKTSHFEEYLRVKEVILLDLLKVISHHRARLATPIRSVQRVMDDSESRHSPFRDMTSRAANEARERPILLLEATASTVDRKEETMDATPSRIKEDQAEATTAPRSSSSSKQPLEGLDSMGLNSKDITLLGAAFEKPPANITDDPQSETPKASTDKITDAHSEVSTPSLQPSSTVPTERNTPSVDGFQENSTKPNEVEDAHTSSPPAPTRPQLGDNLVLGVAIDGPKRILPLDHESSSTSSSPPPSPSERELVASRNGNTPSNTNTKESSETASSKLSPSLDSRENER